MTVDLAYGTGSYDCVIAIIKPNVDGHIGNSAWWNIPDSVPAWKNPCWPYCHQHYQVSATSLQTVPKAKKIGDQRSFRPRCRHRFQSILKSEKECLQSHAFIAATAESFGLGIDIPFVRVVVRVGMKDWDNASWKLWHPAGAADLRPGFRRGDAAGVVDVGETRRLASSDDAAPRACACVEDCGAFGTVVSNAKWFPRPWRVRGFPGVVDLAVPADLVGGAAAATARAAGPPAIDAAAAPAKKTGNRRQRRARLQSGPGAAALGGLVPAALDEGAEVAAALAKPMDSIRR